MYQHLSDTAKDVLKLARELAARDHQEFVGTEHILVAIIDHGLGVGAQVLQDLSVSLSQIQEQIEHVSRSSMEETWVLGRLPGTPHFKQVLAYAIEEAERARNKKVGTEYLLLGLLREKGCVAERVLHSLGVTLHKAQEQVAKQQGRPT